ncbi:MAG: hypothetical protein PHC80_08210, partial [Eubacteriales bacterium]|nr:hypothetical protein [Eubacteriales bacterium]
MKKRIYAVAAVITACALLAGCAAQAEQPASVQAAQDKPALVGNMPASFPLVSAPRSLKIMITGYNGYDQENVYVWQEYEKMTGVDVKW